VVTSEKPSAVLLDRSLARFSLRLDAWRRQARCSQYDDWALVDSTLFGERSSGDRDYSRMTLAELRARRLCWGCEVRAECLEDAVASGDTAGVRGGLLPGERRAVRHLHQEQQAGLLNELFRRRVRAVLRRSEMP
jgi:hypothetical protein